MYRRNICENGRSARSFFREDPSTFCVLPYAKMWFWASRVTHSYTGLEACHWVSLCGGPLRNANRGEFPALAPKKKAQKKWVPCLYVERLLEKEKILLKKINSQPEQHRAAAPPHVSGPATRRTPTRGPREGEGAAHDPDIRQSASAGRLAQPNRHQQPWRRLNPAATASKEHTPAGGTLHASTAPPLLRRRLAPTVASVHQHTVLSRQQHRYKNKEQVGWLKHFCTHSLLTKEI